MVCGFHPKQTRLESNNYVGTYSISKSISKPWQFQKSADSCTADDENLLVAAADGNRWARTGAVHQDSVHGYE